jgi:triphosphatase
MDRPPRSGSSSASQGRPALRLVSGDGAQLDKAAVALRPERAARVELAADASLDDAVARILFACLDHFAANAPVLRHNGDPEAIHQARVALRRLRAFLGLLKRVAPSLEVARTAYGAKSIANALGPARDWQVLREGLEREPRDPLGKDPSFFALLDAVELRRGRAQEAARAAISAPTTLRFVQDLRNFVSRKGWRESAKGTERKGSARVFAVEQLSRLHRRLVRLSKDVASQPPERRHQARIALKKARYAAEFFESLFRPKAARAYLRGLAALQEELGEDNDRATAVRLLEEIAADGTQQAAPAVSALLESRATNSPRGPTKKSEKRLRGLKVFWR